MCRFNVTVLHFSVSQWHKQKTAVYKRAHTHCTAFCMHWNLSKHAIYSHTHTHTLMALLMVKCWVSNTIRNPTRLHTQSPWSERKHRTWPSDANSILKRGASWKKERIIYNRKMRRIMADVQAGVHQTDRQTDCIEKSIYCIKVSTWLL